ncbi:MAG TPA: hypothetical protein ACFCUD_14840 [Cyclobacteriaceae bacterium]
MRYRYLNRIFLSFLLIFIVLISCQDQTVVPEQLEVEEARRLLSNDSLKVWQVLERTGNGNLDCVYGSAFHFAVGDTVNRITILGDSNACGDDTLRHQPWIVSGTTFFTDSLLVGDDVFHVDLLTFQLLKLTDDEGNRIDLNFIN